MILHSTVLSVQYRVYSWVFINKILLMNGYIVCTLLCCFTVHFITLTIMSSFIVGLQYYC